MFLNLFDLIPADSQQPKAVKADSITNTIITPEQLAEISSASNLKQIARDNLAAVHLLLELRGQGRALTDQERLTLLQYRGWGVVADLFRDDPPQEWADLAEQAREGITALAGVEGYDLCRRSTLTAFYTSPWLVQSIYRLLERLGVEQQRLKVLEPGCGTGLFLGLMPPLWRANWTGVEPDPISHQIAQALYPQAQIQQARLEEADLPTEYYDLAVGNVPFMQLVPHDAAFSTWEFGGLHDYCIAKAVSALRPGGIAALLTSVGSLQSKRSQSFRERLSQQVKLITALKLLMMTFWGYSRTQIGADLLVLQKLLPGQLGNSTAWVNLEEMDGFINPETDQPFPVNRWFIEHPESVIGE